MSSALFPLELSVIIPTQGTSPFLFLLSQKLSEQKMNVPFEVLFIENLNGQIAPSLRKQILENNFKIECAYGKGANRARNKGLSVAQGEILLFLDDDCEIPHPNYLQGVLDAHSEYPHFSALGGLYLYPENITPLARSYQAIANFWVKSSQTICNQQVELLGGAASYKHASLKKENLTFNPEIEFGGTESEFNERLFLRGLSTKLDARISNIHHNNSLSLLTFLNKAFLQGQGHARRRHLMAQIPFGYIHPQFKPQGLFVFLYDSAFFAGQKWAERQRLYSYPNATLVLINIIIYFPFFLLKKCRLDSDSLYWQLRRWYDRFIIAYNWIYWRIVDACKWLYWRSKDAWNSLSGVANWLYWRGRDFTWFLYDKLQRTRSFLKWRSAVFASNTLIFIKNLGPRFNGKLISLKWQFINLKNDLSLAWRGYGNHRIFEQFNLNLRPSPVFYQRDEIDWMGVQDLPILVQATPSLQQKPRMFHYEGEKLSTSEIDLFLQNQDKCAGIILSLQQNFKFENMLAFWKLIQIPIYVHGPSNHDALDSVYDELKSMYYMAYEQHPKTVFSTCLKDPGDIDNYLSAQLISKKAEHPLFSVVIPNFNNDHYLSTILDHLKNQDLPPEKWEVIIVDDGSDVSILEKVEEYASKNSQLNISAYRCERTSADGSWDSSYRAGRARNLGVKHSVGEYLLFLDSDILIPNHLLSELQNLFTSYDVIQLRRQMIYEKSSGKLRYEDLKASDIYSESSYWEKFKSTQDWMTIKNYWKYTCTYGLALSRKDFDLAGQFKARFQTYGFEDVDLGYRLSQLGRRFHLSTINAYHLYPKQTIHTCHFDLKRRQESLRKSCREFYLLNLDPEIYRDLYSVLNPPMPFLFRSFARCGKLARAIIGKGRQWKAAILGLQNIENPQADSRS